MNRAETYLEKAKEYRKKYSEHKRNADHCYEEEQACLRAYRIESVVRVMDFIRSEYRNGRVCDLETLLCHCQNKLYGNIDGTELTLDEHLKGVPFKKERESNE